MTKYLAIASSEREFLAARQFAEKRLGKNDKLIVMCHSFSPARGAESSNIVLTSPEEFLADTDIQSIEEGVGFFARNWYRFDGSFEERTTHKGISLGFVHENDLAYFFRTTLSLLKGILKAVERERPDKIIIGRMSFAGKAVSSISKTKNLGNVEFLDLPAEKGFSRFPNISRKKLREIRKQLPGIMSGLLAWKRGKSGGRTVFIRSRGYLGNLEKELQKDKFLNVVSLDEFLFGRLLNPLNAYSYFSTRAAMQKRFKQTFNDFKESRKFGESFVFEGINFGENFALLFPQLIKRDWPEFVFLIDKLSELFKSAKPDALVLWEDCVAFERICALVAKQGRVKSIVLQHGLFRPILEKGDWVRGFAPLTADKIAVWGKRFKDYLVSHGVQSGKIIVTGGPRFDSLATKGEGDQGFLEKIGAGGRELVVFASQQPSVGVNSYFIAKEAMKAMADFNDKQLIIKIHPLEKPGPYQKIAKEMNSNAIVMKDQLYELIRAASVLITHSSTVGLEAMALGKPVIVFAKKSAGQDLFGPTNTVLRAENAEDLKGALQTVFSKRDERGMRERIKKFVFEMMFRQDGKATERVAAIVKEMAG